MPYRASFSLAAVLFFTAFATAAAERSTDLVPKVETFTGNFSQVRLDVQSGWPAAKNAKDHAARSFQLLLGLRDNAVNSIWAVGMNGPEVVHLRQSDARLTEQKLAGTIALFFGDGTTNYVAAADVPVKLDLQREGSALRGTVTVGSEKPAAATGKIVTSEELAKQNAFAAGQNWPNWFGGDRSVRGPDGKVEWIDSLSNIKPVWRSEAFIPTAFGQAADFRYALRAAAQGTCGGASSPVVAGGRVFQYFYQPSGTVDEKALSTALEKAQKPLADFQKAWVADMYRDSADDVIVAIDAATGRTLWRTTLPLRCLNLQTHKHRGVNPTPLVAGDRLFVVNYVGRVYCLDVASGQVKWEYPKPADKPFAGARGQGGSGAVPVQCASPVLIGDVLGVTLKDKLIAIDAASGKELWQAPVQSEAELMPWKSGGKEYFVAVGLKRANKQTNEPEQTLVTLIDPAGGKVLWQKPADFIRQYRLPILTHDLLIAYRYGDKAANNITPGESNSLIAVRLTKDGLEPAWTLKGLPEVTDSYGVCAAGDYVYLSGEKQVWAIEFASGKVVAKVDGAGGARTQVLYSSNDRLFLLPEGRHGNSAVIMLSADGPKMKLFGVGSNKEEPAAPAVAPAAKNTKPKGEEEEAAASFQGWRGAWRTANPTTTAYANHQIIYPVVDGRIFVRGGDGVYCYDLRRSSEK
jgi:outer membrane protein assembly factor BamB